MKKYLATIHEKPDHHKKRFALLVSGCITLLIFAIWSLAHMSGTPEVATGQEEVRNEPTLLDGVAATVRAIRADTKTEAGLEVVDENKR